MTDNIAMPFALSLSKGVLRTVMPFALSLSKGEWHAPRIRSWFDRLTTNGKDVVSHAPRIRSWFDKPVLSPVEGLTTNGKAVVSHITVLNKLNSAAPGSPGPAGTGFNRPAGLRLR